MAVNELVGCYSCGTITHTPWGEENGFEAVKCSDCGLVYVKNPPSVSEINEATQAGLHRIPAGTLDLIGTYDHRRVQQIREELLALYPNQELRSQRIRWLDIGAGFGELIEAVVSIARSGSEIQGIEPCGPKVQSAIARGLDVSARRIQEVRDKFDFISLYYVFSHLRYPVEFLADLKHILNPGGELLLVTGNGGEICRDEYPAPLYLPDHLCFTGEAQLTKILTRAGFQVVKIRRFRFPRDRNTVVGVLKLRLKSVVNRILDQEVSREGTRYIRKFCDLFVRARAQGN